MRLTTGRQGVTGSAGLLLVVGALAACGSSGASVSGHSALQATCTQISGVLANGPDPDADPLGYAEAQILPLRQIKTSDASLQAAVDSLASAYQSVTATKGSKTANQAVAAASSQVEQICPGATS
jgi:hypothetical protein